MLSPIERRREEIVYERVVDAIVVFPWNRVIVLYYLSLT
jgi:hypothetical protein